MINLRFWLKMQKNLKKTGETNIKRVKNSNNLRIEI